MQTIFFLIRFEMDFETSLGSQTDQEKVHLQFRGIHGMMKVPFYLFSVHFTTRVALDRGVVVFRCSIIPVVVLVMTSMTSTYPMIHLPSIL
jgi:hypothetical protein